MKIKYSYHPSLMDKLYLLFNDSKIVTTSVEVVIDGSWCYPYWTYFWMDPYDHSSSISLYAPNVKLKLFSDLSYSILSESPDDYIMSLLEDDLNLIKPLDNSVTWEVINDPKFNEVTKSNNRMKFEFPLRYEEPSYLRISLPHNVYDLNNNHIRMKDFLDNKDIVYIDRNESRNDLAQFKNFMFYLKEIQ